VEALSGGPVTVWVRHPEAMPLRRLVPWLESLRSRCDAAGAALWVADRLDVATLIDADGVHLPGHGVGVAEARRWMAATGHPGGLSVPFHATDDAARVAGADIALVSPYGLVAGKGRALGATGIAEQVLRAGTIPVVALGGITCADNVHAVYAAGATGVAVRGLWLEQPDVAAVLAPLRGALDTYHRPVPRDPPLDVPLRRRAPRANTPRP